MKELLFAVITLGGLGLLFGIILGYSSKKFAVEVDEKVPLIKECLPGANCGGCGYAGCDAYAQAVADEIAATNCCAAAGATGAEKIAEIMGVSINAGEANVAFVKCRGTCDKAKEKGIYYGIASCIDAVNIPGGGSKACEFGCLGLGSCVEACKFDALNIINDIAVIDEDKCIGCGACVKTCPKKVIDLLPVSKKVEIGCNSKTKGIEVKNKCSVGCISCGLCTRNCPEEAIEMLNNLPVVNHEKCIGCGVCIEKCPTHAIVNRK
jgi:electron transport complex protein RnfB